MNKPLKILISPLDWGLGHATRCIPLIEEFSKLGAQISIAGTSRTNEVISKEFPHLSFYNIVGYNIKYSNNKWMLPIVILYQVPKILYAIYKEHRWLDIFLTNNEFDIILSDNRYGFYHHKENCIFLTHQVQIQIPQSKILQKIVNKINHKFISKFNTCWVPDYLNNAMAGNLSTNLGLSNVTYIGNLSRFKVNTNQSPSLFHKRYQSVILLSGPEPQRTMLESKLQQFFLHHTNYTDCLIVQGKPENGTNITCINKQIDKVGYLPAKQLEEVLFKAQFVICRSGYSTIMDLIKLNKNAVLIPTPGQTEQVYLAKYLSAKGWFTYISQQKIESQLKDALLRVATLEKISKFDFELYRHVVRSIYVTQKK